MASRGQVESRTKLIRVNSFFLLVFDSGTCTRGSRQTLISSHHIRSGSIRYTLSPAKLSTFLDLGDLDDLDLLHHHINNNNNNNLIIINASISSPHHTPIFTHPLTRPLRKRRVPAGTEPIPNLTELSGRIRPRLLLHPTPLLSPFHLELGHERDHPG